MAEAIASTTVFVVAFELDVSGRKRFVPSDVTRKPLYCTPVGAIKTRVTGAFLTGYQLIGFSP